MTLLGFLTRRFFFFTAVVSGFFATLFTVVELFEKILRVAHTSIGSIVYFSVLNCVPTWFELLPVGLWLSTILVIRELVMRQEWDFLQMLTFIPRSLILWLAWCSGVCMLTVLVVRESVGVPLMVKAERVRQEKFKRNVQTVLLNQWFELDDATVVYARMIDQQEQCGSDLLIMRMRDGQALETMLMAPHFDYDSRMAVVRVPTGVLYNIPGHSQEVLSDYEFTSPSLFLQVRLQHHVPSLARGVLALVSSHSSLPDSVVREVQRRCVIPFGYYLSLLLYPLLTLALFLLFSSSIMRWVAVLLPYPYFVGAGLGVGALVSAGFPVWFLVLPHGAAFLVVFYVYHFLKKNNLRVDFHR